VATIKTSPEKLAKKALSVLKAKADPKKAAGVQKYFKDTVKAYGVSATDIRLLSKDLHKSISAEWGLDDAVALCDLLFPKPELEAKAVGALILSRFKKEFNKDLFFKVKDWLSRNYLNNWASVDVFCPEVLGSLIVKYPELIQEIKGWTRDPNRWVKRASIVAFLKLTKQEKYHPHIYEIAQGVFGVDDDLVQKASGWLLREAGKTDMGRLEKFLLKHGAAIPRTTLRYAIERFDEKKRKEILLRTR